MSANNRPAAVIFGCKGLSLSQKERHFFKTVNPTGFIIFARNIDNPEQVRTLCAELRSCTDRDDAPILIDEEGGRVARLQPPHWPVFPPAKTFGDLYEKNARKARRACRDNFAKIAAELRKIGVNVDCAPVLDVPVAGANEKVVGDRPFSFKTSVIADLGAVACRALSDGGVLPIIKHIPGHGRATTDSHFELPVVNESRDLLHKTDFKAFRALAKLSPWAMTAHLLYTAVDAEKPASLSRKVIDEIIRGDIGFDGFLICDDLSMKALKGDFADLTAQALDAGCDAVLHCNGDMAEMAKIASAVRPLSDKAMERYRRGQAILAARGR